MTYHLAITDQELVEHGSGWYSNVMIERAVYRLCAKSGVWNTRAGRLHSWRDHSRAAQIYEVRFDSRAWTG